MVTDVTKSSGLFCIRDDLSDEKRHKLKIKNKNFQPLKVTPGLNSSKFEVYKESCAENYRFFNSLLKHELSIKENTHRKIPVVFK